jgi:predicted RNA polymerase sigma factor
MVTLNRAVAAAMVDGPTTGLALLDAIADRLVGRHRLDAVRAHLLEMAGDRDAAIARYRTAAGPRPASRNATTSRHAPRDSARSGRDSIGGRDVAMSLPA